MKFTLQFIPQFVTQLRDVGNYVLKSAYDAFADDIATRVQTLEAARVASDAALATKITQGDGDGRYGQVSAANTWAAQQKFYRASGDVPLWLGQLNSSTGAVREAATIDTIWTDSTDATRTSILAVSTVKAGAAVYERARFGGSVGIKNYGIRVLQNESGSNQFNIAAYFEASGASINVALKTGAGSVEFGGPLDMTGNNILGTGNMALGGVSGDRGNLYVTDKNFAFGGITGGTGGRIVLAGDIINQPDNPSVFCSIRGLKENNTYFNGLGSLAFGTQSDATNNTLKTLSTVTDWMWLTSGGVLELKNTTLPNALDWGDGGIFMENGALKYRGGSGTITTLAGA